MPVELERGDQPDQESDDLNQMNKRWIMLCNLSTVLGLCSDNSNSNPTYKRLTDADTEAINQAINDRQAAKCNKNYAEADRIRKNLIDQGIELIDKPGGVTEWIRS